MFSPKKRHVHEDSKIQPKHIIVNIHLQPQIILVEFEIKIKQAQRTVRRDN
jgi:hypothetical protein